MKYFISSLCYIVFLSALIHAKQQIAIVRSERGCTEGEADAISAAVQLAAGLAKAGDTALEKTVPVGRMMPAALDYLGSRGQKDVAKTAHVLYPAIIKVSKTIAKAGARPLQKGSISFECKPHSINISHTEDANEVRVITVDKDRLRSKVTLDIDALAYRKQSLPRTVFLKPCSLPFEFLTLFLQLPEILGPNTLMSVPISWTIEKLVEMSPDEKKLYAPAWAIWAFVAKYDPARVEVAPIPPSAKDKPSNTPKPPPNLQKHLPALPVEAVTNHVHAVTNVNQPHTPKPHHPPPGLEHPSVNQPHHPPPNLHKPLPALPVSHVSVDQKPSLLHHSLPGSTTHIVHLPLTGVKKPRPGSTTHIVHLPLAKPRPGSAVFRRTTSGVAPAIHRVTRRQFMKRRRTAEPGGTPS